MPINKVAIESLIKDVIRRKLESYNPESSSMPFHYYLLGRARMVEYSFIHSLNTSFGISIFEPVAKELAKSRFSKVDTQVKLKGAISSYAQVEIQRIIDGISSENPSNKFKETEIIRKAVKRGKINKPETVKVDLFLEDHSGIIYLFDIKTAKPNKSGFKDYKRTLLEWVAKYLYDNPDAQVNSYITIPYNPYAPDSYKRWTLNGMLDLPNELKVGKEFWDFVGGDGAYEELLQCFERAGKEVKKEIDEYFQNNFPKQRRR